MHKEILDKNQLDLLPLVKDYKRSFYLVGGTAIALQIGHRRSIDFDLFQFNKLNHKRIFEKIKKHNFKCRVTRRVEEQVNVIIQNVKFTFFEYPFRIEANTNFENIIKMPNLLDLAAMKAYALGRRSKWKDYVDLFFILKEYYTVEQISKRANQLFDQLFSEKQFRAQLCYFKDIDESEEIDFIVNAPSEKKIKEFLKSLALKI